jgi:hypothetical protein
MFVAMGGPTGATGAAGEKGDKGDKGDTGAAGPLNWTGRGDSAAYDKIASGLTFDSAYHDWDLSAICPAGTKLVLLSVQITSTTAGKEARFKTKGNVNDYNVAKVTTQGNGLTITADCLVEPNANRVIQYYFTSGTYSIANLIVRGWWTG